MSERPICGSPSYSDDDEPCTRPLGHIGACCHPDRHRATPEPSAAAQPSGESKGPHANGRPACTCPEEPGPEDPDWDGTLTFDPACPWHGRSAAAQPSEREQWVEGYAEGHEEGFRTGLRAAPEGEGASGAAKRDRWDSFRQMRELHAEIIRLRADRDRLERERDDAIGIGAGMNDGPFTHCRDCGRRMVWQSANHPCPTWLCPQCVYRTKDRLERELEEARSTIRRARNYLKGRVQRCCGWIDAIDGHDDPCPGCEHDLIEYRALHAPTTEDGAPESVGTHPDGCLFDARSPMTCNPCAELRYPLVAAAQGELFGGESEDGDER